MSKGGIADISAFLCFDTGSVCNRSGRWKGEMMKENVPSDYVFLE